MIIAIVTPKGGEAKTTTAMMLSLILSEKSKVLGIDFDVQNSFTFSMGLEFTDEKVKKENIAKYIQTEEIDPVLVNENLSFIPSSLKLASLRTMSQGTLKKVFNETNIRDMYKHIIIDTSPSFDNFMLSAAYAADLVIFPIRLRSVFSQKCLLDTIDMCNYECPSILTKLKVLPTFYENRKDEQNVENYITSEIGDCLLQARIPLTSKALKVASNYKLYSQKGMDSFTEAYRDLAREIEE